MNFTRACAICLLCLFFETATFAQLGRAESRLLYSTGETTQNVLDTSAESFVIREILVAGNKQTKRSTILRELSFYIGTAYSLPELVKRFGEARRQLMNTALFTEVVVSLNSLQGYDAVVKSR
jgi:outer membrane protein assembly factor BamA